MNRSRLARVAASTASVVLLATAASTAAGAAVSAAAAPASATGLRDVTSEQCRSAGGHVEGSGYCVDALGDDAWGQPVDGQAINPDPRPGEE
ncbi:hypothetical protein [Kitasatospora sp. NPDC097691]|uniref:hypothetical protein n=1 Tax=Kitasatospora sp. NPDC097691 TaxID=3157231 RepID=UPI003322F980